MSRKPYEYAVATNNPQLQECNMRFVLHLLERAKRSEQLIGALERLSSEVLMGLKPSIEKSLVEMLETNQYAAATNNPQLQESNLRFVLHLLGKAKRPEQVIGALERLNSEGLMELKPSIEKSLIEMLETNQKTPEA